MINAKAERLTESRAYAPLIGKFRHRCLIIADGFYEWLKSEDPKQPRQPFRFTVDGGVPFAFAGLWTRAVVDGEPVESATILTTGANHLVARLHDRVRLLRRRGPG
jgi:putative SOS response-associated peptidase YedK